MFSYQVTIIKTLELTINCTLSQNGLTINGTCTVCLIELSQPLHCPISGATKLTIMATSSQCCHGNTVGLRPIKTECAQLHPTICQYDNKQHKGLN